LAVPPAAMDDDIQRIYDTLHSVHRRWEIRHGRAEELLCFLQRSLPHIARASWPERFAWGGIFVNGRPAERDCVLKPPCVVEYFVPKVGFAELAALYPEFLPERHLLYQDEDLIVAFKPAGLPSKPSKEQKRYSLLASLERCLGRRLHMPSRLDAATAGVVIASKSRRGHSALQQAFEHRRIHKQYLLEVPGGVEWRETTVDAAIDRDPRHPVLRRVVESGGRQAITRFRRLYQVDRAAEGQERTFTLLLAEPLTGRTHQIRVHSASLGLPLVGDIFYQGPAAAELHLLSYRLQLQHPFTKQRLRVEVPPELLPDWIDGERIPRR